MIKKSLLIVFCLLSIAICSFAFAADTEVTLDTNDTSSGFAVKDSNGNSVMSARGNGKIGIGTTDPKSKLDVRGSIALGYQTSGAHLIDKYVPHHTAGYDGSIGLSYINGTSGIFVNHVMGGYTGGNSMTNEYISFNTHEGGQSSGERMRINPNGNVGIGTASPEATLTVNGYIASRNESNNSSVKAALGTDTTKHIIGKDGLYVYYFYYDGANYRRILLGTGPGGIF